MSQDLAGVESSKELLAADEKDPIVIPDGFVKIVQIRAARDTSNPV